MMGQPQKKSQSNNSCCQINSENYTKNDAMGSKLNIDMSINGESKSNKSSTAESRTSSCQSLSTNSSIIQQTVKSNTGISHETSEIESVVRKENTFFPELLSLKCPVCSNPWCILNKAAQCPILQHGTNVIDADNCPFCGKNCTCSSTRNRFRPITGIVPRDENGIAKTLLSENGGPIKDSKAYANRPRWDTPYRPSWEKKTNEWMSARPMAETIAYSTDVSNEESHNRKPIKKTTKKKNRLSSGSHINDKPRSVIEAVDKKSDQETELSLLIEGQGFKVFNKGSEKILINYNSKNCKYLGCNCINSLATAQRNSCGCTDWQNRRDSNKHANNQITGNHTKTKKHPKLSLIKDSSKDMVNITREDHGCQIYVKEVKNVDDNSKINTKKRLDTSISSVENSKDISRHSLTAEDLLHKSRANLLEHTLQAICGDVSGIKLLQQDNLMQPDVGENDTNKSNVCPSTENVKTGACECNITTNIS